MNFDYRKELRQELESRKNRNSAYSLRAFSRDLGVSLTALHDVLHLRRHFSKKNLIKAAQSLGWTEEQFNGATEAIRSRTRSLQSKAKQATECDIMSIFDLLTPERSVMASV